MKEVAQLRDVILPQPGPPCPPLCPPSVP